MVKITRNHKEVYALLYEFKLRQLARVAKCYQKKSIRVVIFLLDSY